MIRILHPSRFGLHGALAASALLHAGILVAAEAPQFAQVQELSRMSLEELANVEVTSVSKSAQSLSAAPAAIYVITRDEILRSGVSSVPEALRLAPNLQVVQVSAGSYAITARGFGDKREVQTQANKLLILIDGRTVYSPLFSGVFYDAQDIMMEDVQRIEVISGPGATLWGANAMNGVINIITRSSADTPGAVLRAGGGNQEAAASARYGGALGENASYRVYAKAFDRASLDLEDGSSARDHWSKAQGGFRAEWAAGRNSWTAQGDAYEAEQNVLGASDLSFSGSNVLARWQRSGESSQLSIQAYFDHSEREAPSDGAAFELDTYDVEIQHSFALGTRHRIVWGAGKRRHDYDIENVGALQFIPAHRTLDLGNVFAQDSIALNGSLELTVGLKLEDNPYSGWSAMPDVRLSWSASDSTLLWAAAARAIRSPTPFDAEVAELVGGTPFLVGNPNFRSEKVTAYELGYRGQLGSTVTLSVSGFYGAYDDLRTVEVTPVVVLPLMWGNRMQGDTYGVEGWANIQVTPWWRLSPGVRSLHKDLQFKSGASGLLGVEQAGNDPSWSGQLKSFMDFGHDLTLDAFLRYMSELPDPQQDAYFELSARLAWDVSPSLQLAVSGFNLLHDRHTEYPSPIGEQIPRSFFVELRWRR
ncbi:MAG TPA: TonB-dependent receptor [Steroidobacteraceae bacterium]|nr:TonB-dependent receptor [Steroidobacteraceae bacterium]